MTSEALVSIIVPCYNQGAYLIDTLKSVSNQTYKNWECIIVNDGSTDETEKLAKEWCRQNKKFYYFYKSNGGISSTRNLGLEKAKGDYIQWLDGDDFLGSEKIEFSIETINSSGRTGEELVISNFKLFNQDTNEFEPPYCNLEPEMFTYESVLYNWEDGFTIPIHCGFFNASLLKRFRFPEEVKSKEDWLMWIAVFQQDPKVFFINKPLAFYRRHSKSMTRSTDMSTGQIAALDYLETYLHKKEYEHFVRHTMIRYYKSSLYYRKKYLATHRTNTFLLGNLFKRSARKLGLLKPLKRIFGLVKHL